MSPAPFPAPRIVQNSGVLELTILYCGFFVPRSDVSQTKRAKSFAFAFSTIFENSGRKTYTVLLVTRMKESSFESDETLQGTTNGKARLRPLSLISIGC